MVEKKFRAVLSEHMREKLKELTPEEQVIFEQMVEEIKRDPLKGKLITTGKYKGCRYIDAPEGAS